MDELYRKLKDRLKGKVLAVGIGNEDMGDDGAGIRLVQKLESRENFVPLLAHDSPEFRIQDIVDRSPDVVMFVDIADFDSAPGSIAIIESSQLGQGWGNSHRTPLSAIMNYIVNITNSDTFLLGIQPETINQGNTLGTLTQKTINNLAGIINEITTCKEAVYERVPT